MPPSRGKAKGRCSSARRVTAQLLLPFLALSSVGIAAADGRASEQVVLPLPGPALPVEPAPADHLFTLRHIYHHGTHRYPTLHRRQDVHARDAAVVLAAEGGYGRQALPPLRARSQATRIQRLVDRRPSVVDPLVAQARERGYVTALAPEAWTVDAVSGPNVTDKATVLTLAYMASNAYVETPAQPDWDEVGAPFNRTGDFGWEGDGLRGHVFADAANRTVVIGLKGTSLAVFDGEGTTTNDKENDNLFFGCCCGQQGQWTYRQVCDCATGTYACNNTCVRQALRDENRYYMAARELYANVSAAYPDASIWMTGHSLGGSIGSFIGMTYGLPVVTFQAVPEAMAAGRLGLPVPPGADPDAPPQTRALTGTFHFGHTADPIYMGACNGATASCSYAGYALESACHAGSECVYDVVADKGWRVGVGTHRIRTVIQDVLLPYDDVPVCAGTPECRDCAAWKMYESNGTETTTTSRSTSTAKTRTRTQTCQTPGWWGCLDETTTTTTTPTTTRPLTTTTTTATTTATTTTTCKTPGRFWGCRDEPTGVDSSSTTTSTTTSSTATTTAETSTTSTPSTRCLTPGRVWGCWDDPWDAETGSASATATSPARHTITTPPTPPPGPTSAAPPAPTRRCRRRSWFGLCRDWDDEL